MFGRNAHTKPSETSGAPSEQVCKEAKQFLFGIEEIFKRYSNERQHSRKDAVWTIEAGRSSGTTYPDFWRHLEIELDGTPVALLNFRIIDHNLVGTLAIKNWNGLSVYDCDWLLFAMATMLTKAGLSLLRSAKLNLRTTMNEAMWNKVSGAALSVCPRASISVPITALAPLTSAEWYNLDDLARNLERAHEIGS